MALYFNKLEFHLLRDTLQEVWLASWFRRRFLQFFSAFLLFCYYLPLEKGYPLHLYKLESPLPKDDLCNVWLTLTHWFWRRRFSNDSTQFSHFCNYLPFEEDLALYVNNLNFSLPNDDLNQVWLKLASWFSRREFFSITTNLCKYGFPYCGPSLPTGTMMWTILNLHYIRKLSCKNNLFWLSGSVEEDFYMTPPRDATIYRNTIHRDI
jgi:hypothetical protein